MIRPLPINPFFLTDTYVLSNPQVLAKHFVWPGRVIEGSCNGLILQLLYIIVVFYSKDLPGCSTLRWRTFLVTGNIWSKIREENLYDIEMIQFLPNNLLFTRKIMLFLFFNRWICSKMCNSYSRWKWLWPNCEWG